MEPSHFQLIRISLCEPYSHHIIRWVTIKGNDAFNVLSFELCQQIPAFLKWSQIGLAIDAHVSADPSGVVFILCDASSEIDFFVDNFAHKLGELAFFECKPAPHRYAPDQPIR